jgi:hypothetical protein
LGGTRRDGYRYKRTVCFAFDKAHVADVQGGKVTLVWRT